MAKSSNVLKLSRKKDHRRLLIRGLVTSLVLDEKLVTTKPKARAVVPYFERLVTKAKKGDLHNRRQVTSKVSDAGAVSKLFDDLAKRFSKRQGGYTRVTRVGWRQGDDAELVRVSLTEQPVRPKTSTTKKSPTKAKAKPAGGKKPND